METVLISIIVVMLVAIVLFWFATLYKSMHVINNRKRLQLKAAELRRKEEQHRKYKQERLSVLLRLHNSGYPIDDVVKIVHSYRSNVNK